MIEENYVSFEVAKLLKEKGFNLWCYKCYGDAVYHKGVPISFDEECELKDEGLEDEIEYVEGGYLYDFGCNNRKEDAKVYAAPTLQRAIKWLEEVHHILVVPDYIYECTPYSWSYKIYRLGENGKPERCVVKGVRYDKEKEDMVEEIVGYRDYDRSYESYERREEAVDEGIRYVLKKYV